MALFYVCRNCIPQIQLLRWVWWAPGRRCPSQPYEPREWMEVEEEVLSMGPAEHGWTHWMSKCLSLGHSGRWCIPRRSMKTRVTTSRLNRVYPHDSNDLTWMEVSLHLYHHLRVLEIRHAGDGQAVSQSCSDMSDVNKCLQY